MSLLPDWTEQENSLLCKEQDNYSNRKHNFVKNIFLLNMKSFKKLVTKLLLLLFFFLMLPVTFKKMIHREVHAVIEYKSNKRNPLWILKTGTPYLLSSILQSFKKHIHRYFQFQPNVPLFFTWTDSFMPFPPSCHKNATSIIQY